MKRLIILPLAFIFISLGCKKLKDLTTFSINNSTEFIIPNTGLVTSLITLPQKEVETSSAYEFKNNKTDASHVQEVKLNKLTLNILSPASETFSFLNKIDIYISADGLPEKRLAYKENIPSDIGRVLQLDVTGEILDPYIKKDKYKLRIDATADEVIPEDVTIRSDMEFRVRAKIL